MVSPSEASIGVSDRPGRDATALGLLIIQRSRALAQSKGVQVLQSRPRQQSRALSVFECAKCVPKVRVGAIRRLCLCRSADHRVQPARLFTRRLLCLLSYTGGRL